MLTNGLKLAIHGISDVGLSREHNEDSISWDRDMGLVMLADGMVKVPLDVGWITYE